MAQARFFGNDPLLEDQLLALLNSTLYFRLQRLLREVLPDRKERDNDPSRSVTSLHVLVLPIRRGIPISVVPLHIQKLR